VDVTNPGQFFACCGLFDLASRLNPEAKAWFAPGFFFVSDTPPLPELIGLLRGVLLVQTDPEDTTASPIEISSPFSLRLDWWKSRARADSDLKVWAGTMESFRIARAMQNALRADAFASEDLLNTGVVAYDPDAPDKKVEPFYFDARRGPNAHSRDVGFAPNDLGLTTIASPAVELLCLIGLQRTRPVRTDQPRVFDYHAWSSPLPAPLAPAAVAGLLPALGGPRYRFESWFRTGQRKHKAFLTAKLINP
jgi:CRISPR-associated protein Csb3